MPETRVLFTVEHGGNKVPAAYRELFAPHHELLQTHRGWDPGALPLARRLAKDHGAPVFHSTTTRLLVELNRSPGHKALFSRITKPLPRAAKAEILRKHWHPYRDEVQAWIAEAHAAKARVLHLSIHSFTPELNGEVRNCEVGYLYDPSRPRERALCRAWGEAIRARSGALRVRYNYPYHGRLDGFVTYLRRRLPPARYVCMELEVNQALYFAGGRVWSGACAVISEALGEALASLSN